MIPIDEFDFSEYKKLQALAKYESAKKRTTDEVPPHVPLMKKLAIADYEAASDKGNMRFYPNGRLIKSLLEKYVTDEVVKYGGSEVETPIMYDSKHPSMACYFNRYSEKSNSSIGINSPFVSSMRHSDSNFDSDFNACEDSEVELFALPSICLKLSASG